MSNVNVATERELQVFFRKYRLKKYCNYALCFGMITAFELLSYYNDYSFLKTLDFTTFKFMAEAALGGWIIFMLFDNPARALRPTEILDVAEFYAEYQETSEYIKELNTYKRPLYYIDYMRLLTLQYKCELKKKSALLEQAELNIYSAN